MSGGANAFGSRFILVSFGESHGAALGCVIDGCPAGVEWDEGLLLAELARRRPGQASPGGTVLVTERNEADRPEILSGVYEGRTLGTPIAAVVRNADARSSDYHRIEEALASGAPARTGHADDVWRDKFGHSDPRGGGRSSGRETLARSIGGAVAQMFLRTAAPGLRVRGFVSKIGSRSLSHDDRAAFARRADAERWPADAFPARFPSPDQTKLIENDLRSAKADGKSFGAEVEIWIDGAPRGLGQPAFRKLKSDLASAFVGVGAVNAVEFGAGFAAASAEGSAFHARGAAVYGGIRGGISDGERIVVRVGIKPTSSVLDVAKRGRHDPCIAPRALPVLEAMAWLTLADHVLWARADRA